MQIPNVDNGLEHVAYVESVDPDGTWHISEMNVVGFDEIDTKAIHSRLPVVTILSTRRSFFVVAVAPTPLIIKLSDEQPLKKYSNINFGIL